MGKKVSDEQLRSSEKEGIIQPKDVLKSAFNVAPPLSKREHPPPSVCNCQPCQQTAASGFTAFSQPVQCEPRFMSLQSITGVNVPPSVYLPTKSKYASCSLLVNFFFFFFIIIIFFYLNWISYTEWSQSVVKHLFCIKSQILSVWDIVNVLLLVQLISNL